MKKNFCLKLKEAGLTELDLNTLQGTYGGREMTWKKFGFILFSSILSTIFLGACIGYATRPQIIVDAVDSSINPETNEPTKEFKIEQSSFREKTIHVVETAGASGYLFGIPLGILINAGVAATSDN